MAAAPAILRFGARLPGEAPLLGTQRLRPRVFAVADRRVCSNSHLRLRVAIRWPRNHLITAAFARLQTLDLG